MINTRPVFDEAEFRKASASEPNMDCVHVARRGGRVAVRDTKKVFGTTEDQHLMFDAAQFDGFLNRLS